MKPSKAHRALVRWARTEPLNWRWPAPLGDMDALRDAVRDGREAIGQSPRGDDHACAVYLRHYCSNYDEMLQRAGVYPPARQTLRERTAEEMAQAYPDLAEAARTSAQRETDRMRLSSARAENRTKRLSL